MAGAHVWNFHTYQWNLGNNDEVSDAGLAQLVVVSGTAIVTNASSSGLVFPVTRALTRLVKDDCIRAAWSF